MWLYTSVIKYSNTWVPILKELTFIFWTKKILGLSLTCIGLHIVLWSDYTHRCIWLQRTYIRIWAYIEDDTYMWLKQKRWCLGKRGILFLTLLKYYIHYEDHIPPGNRLKLSFRHVVGKVTCYFGKSNVLLWQKLRVTLAKVTCKFCKVTCNFDKSNALLWQK